MQEIATYFQLYVCHSILLPLLPTTALYFQIFFLIGDFTLKYVPNYNTDEVDFSKCNVVVGRNSTLLFLASNPQKIL